MGFKSEVWHVYGQSKDYGHSRRPVIVALRLRGSLEYREMYSDKSLKTIFE